MNISTKINIVLGGCAIKELGKNVIVFTSKEIKIMLQINASRKLLTLSVAATLLISGCASNDPIEVYVERQQDIVEKQNKEAQEVFSAVPKWFLSPPQNDDAGIYAVGTATSNNLQFTMNQAKLNAEFTLAKNLNQEVSGRERAFMRSGSQGNVESDAESVVTKFVDSADIVGVNTVENDVQLVNGKYTVYTLLHLSYDQQATILSRKAGNATRVAAKEAYSEIEAEVRRRATEKKAAETTAVPVEPKQTENNKGSLINSTNQVTINR